MHKSEAKVIGLLWLLAQIQNAYLKNSGDFSRSCTSYTEKIPCQTQDSTRYISAEACLYPHAHHSCSCIPNSFLTNDSETSSICQSLDTTKLDSSNPDGEGSRRRRQLEGSGLCEGIQPPEPGKASCTVTPNTVSCIGTCDIGFEFYDGSQQFLRICNKNEGVWRSSAYFPDCIPVCKPPCQNRGNCTEFSVCSCPNEFRGSYCQYSINLCSLSKNDQPSSWQCNHTRLESTCDISCNPPGSPEALAAIRRHSCTINGQWNPPLPRCVSVQRCFPPDLPNGYWNLESGDRIVPGSKVKYSCNANYVMRGISEAVCNSDGTWTTGIRQCERDLAIVPIRCRDPGTVVNGIRTVESPDFLAGSTISFRCGQGYFMTGEPVIFCQLPGQWSSRKPLCVQAKNIPAACSEPNAPKNSIVHVSFPDEHPLRTLFNPNISLTQRLFLINFHQNFTDSSSFPKEAFVVGTRIQYKCKSRFYKLYGSEYQTCLNTGSWSGYQPACIPICGKSDAPRTPFIVNGNSSLIGQWPWQVGLAIQQRLGYAQIVCGGALISEEWVLTAAHCVTKRFSNNPMDASTVLGYLGKYYRSFEKDDEYVQIKRIRQIIVHHDYDFIRYDSDVALLQLDSPVEFTTRVQIICLPNEESTRNNIRDGKNGIVIGWGLKEDGRFSEILRETTMPVVNHEKCEDAYKEGLRTLTVTENMFCAGHDSGASDTCSGDSGGPFMFAGSVDKRWFVEGLVSWGSESGCGKAMRYSGFSKVGRFVSWINMFI